MSIERKPIQTSELLASRLPFTNGFFVVGPFAGRVSFSSQQRRAISLVCDIDRDFKTGGVPKGLVNKPVAIIGAGVAGLTAAVTVVALGGRAHIFDKSPRQYSTTDENYVGQVLSTIREANHRDAHPTLNFWPHEDIEPFTRLPVLNWHEGDCSRVAAQIVKGFSKLLENQKIRNKITIVSGCAITSVAQDAEGKWLLGRSMAGASTFPIDDIPYEVVISATGFGKERSVPGAVTPSYWDPKGSFVSHLCANAPEEIEHYVISGTGDGGLIETLRLLFKTTRAGNFDEKTLALLTDEDLREEVAKIEKEAYRRRTDYILHERPSLTPKARKQMDADRADALSIFLWNNYERVARNKISPQVARDIENDRSTIDPVILLRTKSHPMEISASPYHRLLIAFAISKGWVKYTRVKGETAVIGRANTLSFNVNAIEQTMELVKLHFMPHASKRPIEYDNCFFLARHGYISPLEDLWRGQPANIDRIRFQQQLYADQDELQPRYAEMIAHAVGRKDPNDIKAFAGEMTDHVHEYFKERFGLSIKFTREGAFSWSGSVISPQTNRVYK